MNKSPKIWLRKTCRCRWALTYPQLKMILLSRIRIANLPCIVMVFWRRIRISLRSSLIINISENFNKKWSKPIKGNCSIGKIYRKIEASLSWVYKKKKKLSLNQRKWLMSPINLLKFSRWLFRKSAMNLIV